MSKQDGGEEEGKVAVGLFTGAPLPPFFIIQSVLVLKRAKSQVQVAQGHNYSHYSKLMLIQRQNQGCTPGGLGKRAPTLSNSYVLVVGLTVGHFE